MSEKNHAFAPSLAREFGVDEAIAIYAFQWFIGQHRDRGEYFFDERWWCYYSVADLAKEWDYWTLDQVRRIINSLVDKGVLLRGSYWKQAGWKLPSRVTWFAFADEARFLGKAASNAPGKPSGENPKSKWRKPQMDLGETTDASGGIPKTSNEVLADSVADSVACMTTTTSDPATNGKSVSGRKGGAAGSPPVARSRAPLLLDTHHDSDTEPDESPAVPLSRGGQLLHDTGYFTRARAEHLAEGWNLGWLAAWIDEARQRPAGKQGGFLIHILERPERLAPEGYLERQRRAEKEAVSLSCACGWSGYVTIPAGRERPDKCPRCVRASQ